MTELHELKQDSPFICLINKYSLTVCGHAQPLSCVWLFATLWTVLHQAPLSMGFSRQNTWNELPFTPPGDLPDPRIELLTPAIAGGPYRWATWKPSLRVCCCCWVASVVSTLCDPIDSSPPGFPVPGILQARTLGWVAISFSNVCKWKVKVKSLSHVQLLATPWTAAHQAPLSMGFSRQEYWSGVPLPSPH